MGPLAFLDTFGSSLLDALAVCPQCFFSFSDIISSVSNFAQRSAVATFFLALSSKEDNLGGLIVARVCVSVHVFQTFFFLPDSLIGAIETPQQLQVSEKL